MLEPVKQLAGVIPFIRHHHEHYDGSGYPDGIRGDQIPLEARILTVADSFEAMTSNRPYRKAMTPQEALGELQEKAGTQFDPRVVQAFCTVFEKGEITASSQGQV
jgi:HD-GYP domain-containing protein (c-di-GMP phosphodiesterase class II)